MRVLNVAWKGCMGVGVLAAAAALALYYYQERILFIPNPSAQMSKLTRGNQRGYRKPSEYFRNGQFAGGKTGDTIPFEEDYLTTPDGVKIHVWLMYHALPPGKKALPTLVILCLFVD